MRQILKNDVLEFITDRDVVMVEQAEVNEGIRERRDNKTFL